MDHGTAPQREELEGNIRLGSREVNILQTNQKYLVWLVLRVHRSRSHTQSGLLVAKMPFYMVDVVVVGLYKCNYVHVDK